MPIFGAVGGHDTNRERRQPSGRLGVTSFREIWQPLRQRPVAAASTALSLTLLLHFPGRAAGDAVSSWVNGQMPAYFGISTSGSPPVLEILMNWILPFVAAAAVMAAYHATRPTSRDGDRAEIVPSAIRSSPDNLQTWFLVAYALAIFSIGNMLLTRPAATSYVAPTPAGPDARADAIIHALETPLSPPPPAQPDPTDRAYAGVVKAMATLSWLDHEHAQFERAAAQYDGIFESILSDLQHNHPVQDKELKLYQNAITNMAKTDLSQSIDLTRHPGYDQHPQRPVPSEDTIVDESDKAAYRRYQSQYQTAKSTIDGINRQYEEEMKRARWVIFGFASEQMPQNARDDDPSHATPASDQGGGRRR